MHCKHSKKSLVTLYTKQALLQCNYEIKYSVKHEQPDIDTLHLHIVLLGLELCKYRKSMCCYTVIITVTLHLTVWLQGIRYMSYKVLPNLCYRNHGIEKRSISVTPFAIKPFMCENEYVTF